MKTLKTLIVAFSILSLSSCYKSGLVKPIKKCGTVMKVEKVVVIPFAPQYINTVLMQDGKVMEIATKEVEYSVGEMYCQ